MSNTIKRPILFITGLSGAGISTSLKALEDIGYEVFDNFPLSQIHSVLNEDGYENTPIAFGFDSRTRAFNPDNMIKMAEEVGAFIVFLNTTNADLQKRFSETRRKHPLAKDRTVIDGIIHERQWLEPLIDAANLAIDTTDLSVHDLKHLIEAKFSLQSSQKPLSVTVMSFGFKYGVPREVDMMLDVRFLKNPHWDKALKSQTGKDKDVQDYIQSDPKFDEFLTKTKDMVDFLLPNYKDEGKKYFTIAFGCTGGRHRSVFISELLSKHIENLGYPTTTRHRNL